MAEKSHGRQPWDQANQIAVFGRNRQVPERMQSSSVQWLGVSACA